MKPYNPLFLIMIEGFDEDGWGELFFGIIISIISIIKLKVFNPLLLFLPILWIIASLVYAGISILYLQYLFYYR